MRQRKKFSNSLIRDKNISGQKKNRVKKNGVGKSVRSSIETNTFGNSAIL